MRRCVPPSPRPMLLDRQPGEALCPQRFDVTALENLRRKLGTYSFSALYQFEKAGERLIRF